MERCNPRPHHGLLDALDGIPSQPNRCSVASKEADASRCLELLQNMHHHAIPDPSHPRFTIYSTASKSWRIEASNAIDATHATDLQETWETLKSKCKHELRAMQRDKLAGESRSDHGGGGVGLNEILRKAAGRVDMNIENQAEVARVTFSAEIPLES